MGTIIKVQDSLEDIVIKLSKGNPGAITVLCRMLKSTAAIDPDSALGALTCLRLLDTMGIYGDGIWLLYKDICGEDLVKAIAVIRATQLGIIHPDKVVEAIDCHRTANPAAAEIYPDDLLAKVQERLPDFGKVGEEQDKEPAADGAGGAETEGKKADGQS